MIIFTVLLSVLLAVAIVATIIALAAGVGFVAVFGDLIVFGLIVALIVKLFKRKK